MSYTAYTTDEIAVGKSIKRSLWLKAKDNFTDHETRIDNLEGGVGKIIVADFEVTGYISHYSASELLAIATHRAPADFNLVEFVVTIMDSANGFDAGGSPVTSSTSGALELDLKKSTDGGITYNTILTTKPSIIDGENGAGANSNDGTNTAVVFSDTAIEQDDLLRIDVTGLKDTQGTFHISVYGTLD